MSLSSLAEEEVANAQRRVSVTDYGAGLVAPRTLTTTTLQTLNLRDRTAARRRPPLCSTRSHAMSRRRS